MRFLVTAGPTREPIDPVRYLSNRSSGKMGYAIAEAALEAGHEVVLISGPVNLKSPGATQFVGVMTSDEMHDAVHRHLSGCDIVVMCAAVADYKPAIVHAEKIKKSAEPFALDLIPTRDILASLPRQNRHFLVVGFAAETNNIEKYANQKLREKHCDIIVANDVGIGMETDENEVTILFRNNEQAKISRASKQKVARELVKIFLNSCEKRLTIKR
ncbi:MAG: phosphopantothenoylcysteine decarboxylase [Verrucomicrobiota bacterium]